MGYIVIIWATPIIIVRATFILICFCSGFSHVLDVQLLFWVLILVSPVMGQFAKNSVFELVRKHCFGEIASFDFILVIFETLQEHYKIVFWGIWRVLSG